MTPYIAEQRRELATERPINPGDLAFNLADLINNYLRDKPRLTFADLNEVTGVLAGLQAEFYRRVVAPYEDTKRAENGEVFDVIWKIHAEREEQHLFPELEPNDP